MTGKRRFRIPRLLQAVLAVAFFYAAFVVVFDVLLGLVRETGMAALIATHNPELAARMDRILRLSGGRVVG